MKIARIFAARQGQTTIAIDNLVQRPISDRRPFNKYLYIYWYYRRIDTVAKQTDKKKSWRVRGVKRKRFYRDSYRLWRNSSSHESIDLFFILCNVLLLLLLWYVRLCICRHARHNVRRGAKGSSHGDSPVGANSAVALQMAVVCRRCLILIGALDSFFLFCCFCVRFVGSGTDNFLEW